MSFLNFRTLAAIFEFYMASQKPRNPLKTFLEPVASFSQSMGPFRAMAPPFMPKSMESGIPLVLCGDQTCAVWRDQTCAVLRDQTCAVLRDQTCAVLRDQTCAVLGDQTCTRY